MIGEIVLDYTTIARPFGVSQVKDDVDDLYVGKMLTANKIILWEHQLDWLIKDAGGYGCVAPHFSEGVRLWHIPLEVRKP